MEKKNFREEVSEKFVKALEEDPIAFIKGWDFSATGSPCNGFTNKNYNGVNKMYLKMIEMERNYVDNRWLTFKQIQEKEYHLEKGATGTKVEYWLPYDKKEKRWITWEEYEKASKSDDHGEHSIELRQKIYTVFNASQIKGIEPKEFNLRLNDIKEEDVISRISEALGVPIIEKFNSPQAFYSPGKDEITLPAKEQFKSQGDYARTALHELGHSTGHETRLNRDLSGRFGTGKYGFEELVAEVTSAFMGEYVKEPISDDNIENHKAYIQGWVKNIKEDKSFLFNLNLQSKCTN